MTIKQEQIQHYFVWDSVVRLFHWVNALSILGLIALGAVILNSKALGVTNDGKTLLKTIHVYIGYIFVVNLIWRVIWGFMGNRYARWNAILPIGYQYHKQLQAFKIALKHKKTTVFMGHNPFARWMVTFMFLLLSIMAASGLVLGGTDLYMPPFGHTFKSWIAQSSDAMALVKPYSNDGVNHNAYETMREFRKFYIAVHYYVFYLLLGAIFLHLFMVIVTEFRERSTIISAMVTGVKRFDEKPIDYQDGY
jgi:Ni,Fe-hydrogenase I cytochrome b subunit